MSRRRLLGVVCVLVLAPFLAMAPDLLGIANADPLPILSGLGVGGAAKRLFAAGYPGWADGNAGVTTEALGHLAATDWLRGIVPWWNPWSGIGMPLAAEMQNSALFLPFVLLLAIPHGVLLLRAAMQAVAGIATFALLRSLGVRSAIAAGLAFVFEFCGTFAWYAHGPVMPVPFLPLLLLGIERCRPGRGHRLSPLLVAGAVAFSLTAGFPETAYLDGLMAAVFAAVRLRHAGAAWRGFAVRLGFGVLVGLLLAAPATLPFLDYLRDAEIGPHADERGVTLAGPNLAMFAFPYVFGPVLWNDETTHAGAVIWWHQGGTFGLPLFVLAVAGAWRGRGIERELRRALAFFVLVGLGASLGFAPARTLLSLLPGVRHAMFSVYLVPSWEMAAVLFAALDLEAWMRRPSRAGDRVALAVGCVAALGCLAAGVHEIGRLMAHAPGYLRVAGPPCALAVLLASFLIAARAGPGGAGRLRVALGALACASALDFATPLLSMTETGGVDMGAIRYLRAHLGLGRFSGLSVLQPNYGAYWRIAQVNSIGLPVPANWVRFLAAHLNPTLNGVQFFGNDLRMPAGGIIETLSPTVSADAALRVYAGLGVRFLLVPHGFDPSRDRVGADLGAGEARPFELAAAGGGVTLDIASGRLPGHVVDGASVFVGTYGGASDGTLEIRVCDAAGACGKGRAPLEGAADNAILDVALDRPLRPGPAGRLTLTVTHLGAHRPVVVWTLPRRGEPGVQVPAAAVTFRDARRLAPVRVDPHVDILPLPDPAPYLEATGGGCRIEAAARLAATVVCAGPGRLVRRELALPGWHVTRNGLAVPVATVGEIFQAVPLVGGTNRIAFRYLPPTAVPALAAAMTGLLAIAAFVLVPVVRQRRASDGASDHLAGGAGERTQQRDCDETGQHLARGFQIPE